MARHDCADPPGSSWSLWSTQSVHVTPAAGSGAASGELKTEDLR